MPPQTSGRRHHESSARRHHHGSSSKKKKTSSGNKKKKSSSSSSKEDRKSSRTEGASSQGLSIDALNRLNAKNATNGQKPHWQRDAEFKSRGEIRRTQAEEAKRAEDERKAAKKAEKQAEKKAEKKAQQKAKQKAQQRAERKREEELQNKRKRPKYPPGYEDVSGYTVNEDEIDDDDDGYETYDDGYARVAEGGTRDRHHRRKRDRRIPSGAILEEGRSRGHTHLRGGAGPMGSSSSGSDEKEALYYTKGRKRMSKRKKLCLIGSLVALAVVILIIIIAVVVSNNNKKHSSSSSSSGSGSSSGNNDNLNKISPSSIPSGAPSYLNPYTWKDTTDFNLTYTDVTVGGLPIMGLNTEYDDSKAATDDTPALNQDWGSYASRPARGVNLGGWLYLEPFITPSFFSGYASNLGIIDEYTLCSHLGASACADKMEEHYATFVTEQTFKDIAAAGLDHVRIGFSYWAVETYEGDPYVFRTSWRYLLRGIEWARQNGLRVNLDLHGMPGSQNGWNHSGRQGMIGWLNGTDGDLNGQRSLDVHDKLSQFFAQPRYKNVISHYGLGNEPRMTFLPMAKVMNWTQSAAALVRKNGVADSTVIVFGDGFCGLDKWQGQPNKYNMALDVHQYEIFNNAQIVYSHKKKIEYACSGWTNQTEQSMDTSTGFGPTIIAEWSQADTDCTPYLGNVNNGNRWTGTYNVGDSSLNALTPKCPAEDSTCSCTEANADPSDYSAAYKSFLLTFAEAQMYSFEKGWGWWYWTWDTESATQWSYKKGLAAGILPSKPGQRTFNCDLNNIPDFSGLPETY